MNVATRCARWQPKQPTLVVLSCNYGWANDNVAATLVNVSLKVSTGHAPGTRWTVHSHVRFHVLFIGLFVLLINDWLCQALFQLLSLLLRRLANDMFDALLLQAPCSIVISCIQHRAHTAPYCTCSTQAYWKRAAGHAVKRPLAESTRQHQGISVESPLGDFMRQYLCRLSPGGKHRN